MKQMIYQKDRKIELLDEGTCFGYKYYILNLGTHPTAYVKIPKKHPYFGKNYNLIDIYVHGGLTYSDFKLWISEVDVKKGWFIGWDYAHLGDYCGYEEMLDFSLGEKKWTTEEIKEEVSEVCKQLKRMEKQNDYLW